MDGETHFFASQIFPSFTVLFHDNMVIFPENMHYRLFIICKCRWYVRYLLWVQNVTVGPLSLTHWGRVMHICVSELTIIGSDNGLSPGRRQAITWTNVGILLIEPAGTNFSEISIGIQTFSFKKMHLNMSSAKWRPFCLSLNVLMCYMRYSDVLHSVIMELDFMSWRLLLVNHLLVSKFFISWCPFHYQNCNQISNFTYCQTSKIRCTESQNLNVSRLVLHSTLPNPLKPDVKSRMKM